MNHEFNKIEKRYRKQIHNRNSCICCLIGFSLVLLILTTLLFSVLYYIAAINYKNSLDKNNETTIKNKSLNTFRLSDNILPIKYDLVLHPNLQNGSLNGRVNILLNITRNQTDLIKLHGKYLIFDEVKLFHMKSLSPTVNEFSNIVKVLEFTENVHEEIWLIKFSTILLPDIYELIIVYHSAPIKNHKTLVGFYKSVYKNIESNETRSIATSKFEPTYARQAFPCFDEPHMKAKYSVKLVRPTNDNYIALSNMDQINEEQYSDTETLVTFKESVPMSTYLSCFIVCDFNYTEEIIQPPKGLGDPFPFRVYATPAQKNKTIFALQTGAKIIKFYIDYFQISYPLPKLDMAAIPDFSSGAMETWGLITFRETAVLFSPNTSSIKNKERVATVVAHELAHMWFGNLVTMNWWNELWLNEGFATFIEYLGVDHVYKDWQMENQFIIAELHRAFETDAKLSSHPIVVSVTNPDEITAVFDAISYSKGASILRMLRNFVGEEEFRQGITDYLNKNIYGNAKSEDLYQAIQNVIGNKINVTNIMYTWTKQMGYPEIFVNASEKNDGVYEITQNRFLLRFDDNYDKSESEFGYRWTIPITYITDLNPEPKLEFFEYTEPKFEVKVDPSIKWIKFNVGQNGYYRVNYNTKLWKNLIQNYENFSIADRTSLLNDAFSLADARRLEYTVPLTLAQKLSNENDTIPWKFAAEAFYKLKRLLFDSDSYLNFQKYVLNLLQPILKNINWEVEENEPHLLRHLRIVILNLACEFDDPHCLEEAGRRLKSYCDDKTNEPHQDIRSIVFVYGMWSIGTQKEWDILWDRYLQESDAQVKDNFRAGLSYVRNPVLISRYLKLAWNPEYVRRQDYITTLIRISENPIGTSIVWDNVRDNWELLVKEIGLNDRYLGRMIPEITESFTSERKLNEIKEFFAKYPNAGAGASARRQALENVETNIKWLERNLEDIKNWLTKNLK